jgi:hypothetical protein
MTFQVDSTPPPPSLTRGVEDLQVGQSLLAPETELATLRNIVLRVKRRHPGRQYTTRQSEDGPRVWRLADQ